MNFQRRPAVYLVGKKQLLGWKFNFDPILRLVKEGEDPVRVKATESKDTLVQITASYLDSINWPERLQVHKGYYTKFGSYLDPGGLSWYIVLFFLLLADDFVQQGSAIEGTIIAMILFAVVFPFGAGLYEYEKENSGMVPRSHYFWFYLHLRPS